VTSRVSSAKPLSLDSIKNCNDVQMLPIKENSHEAFLRAYFTPHIDEFFLFVLPNDVTRALDNREMICGGPRVCVCARASSALSTCGRRQNFTRKSVFNKSSTRLIYE
jgi:hypothetical protein